MKRIEGAFKNLGAKIWHRLILARYWLRSQLKPFIYLSITIGVATYLTILLKWWMLLVLAGAGGGLLFAYKVLGPWNRWYTFVDEGTAKIVMRGKRYHKTLIQWKGWTLDREGNVIPEGVWTKNGRPLIEKNGKLYEEVLEVKEKEVEEKGKKRIIQEWKRRRKRVQYKDATPPRWEPWHPFGGFRFYSFFHPLDDIYVYYFSWTTVTEAGVILPHPSQEEVEKRKRENEKAIEEGEKPPYPYPEREKLDYILLKDDVYFAKVKAAEDRSLVPLDLELLLTTRVVNPRKALFAVEDWLEAMVNRTEPAVRDATTRDVFDNLIRQKAAIGDTIFGIMSERGILDGVFRDTWGLWLRTLDVRKIDPSEKEYREIILQQRTAEYERQAILVKADAERQRLITVAEGERERIKRVYGQIKEFADLGRLIRTLEAAEKSPLPASLAVHAVPGLQEILRGVFGQVPEVISREEITAIRKLLEEVREKLAKKEEE